ncbi:hypothetical protein BDW62DRAFT_58339 [Aspergillus aurantiobrunneus]
MPAAGTPTKSKVSLRELIADYNIRFHSKDDPLPENLRGEYQAVQLVDGTGYEEYCRRLKETEAADQPGSQETIRRTLEIWEAVNWCKEYEHSEGKWRQEVEAKIFSAITKHPS